MKATHFPSGDLRLDLAKSVNVSPSVQRYVATSHLNCRFPARNSICCSVAPKSKVVNGSLEGSKLVSTASDIAAANLPLSNNDFFVLSVGSTIWNSFPRGVLTRYQKRLPSLSQWTSIVLPKIRLSRFQVKNC